MSTEPGAAQFDNSGKYSVGSSVTVPGPDNVGGTWTYTVTSLADADAKHQDLSYENFAYDLTYKDADLGTVTNTLFGTVGFSSGVNDRTVNYSGNGGLGSDGDVVAVNGKDFAIASGKYVVPEPQTDAGTMQLDTFTAVESVTGDHINGVLFDNTGTYSVGSSVTVPGPDNMGGHWTYTVNSIAAADSAHQEASYNGMVYDLTYFDADTGTSYNTLFGRTGLTTGAADRTANYSGKRRARLRRRRHRGRRQAHRHRKRQIRAAGCERRSADDLAGERRPERQSGAAHQRHGGIRHDDGAGRHVTDRSVRAGAAAPADIAACVRAN